MRPSNRTQILQAAAAVVERSGVTAVTLDSVAAEAGLTKGGLMYHFATRGALLQAVHEYLAAQWEDELRGAAGPDPASATQTDRLAAYIKVATRSATRAELLFMLEGSTTPDHVAPWNGVLDRWTPPLEDNGDEHDLTAAVARLAADGLWMYEALTGTRISPALRDRLVDHITDLAAEPDPGAD